MIYGKTETSRTHFVVLVSLLATLTTATPVARKVHCNNLCNICLLSDISRDGLDGFIVADGMSDTDCKILAREMRCFTLESCLEYMATT